ncbi:hypothetical protein H0W91_03485, partial [Patescibacteria group bacterium]|nr:hypothetical protein [Patescibacteria group bacterium]
MDIIQILVQKGILPQTEVSKVTEDAVSSGITIEEALIRHGIKPIEILKIKGEHFDIPVKNLEGVDIDSKVLEYVAEDSVLHYKFIPIAVNNGMLEIGMVDPDDIEARDALNFIASKTGLPFKIFLISQNDFDKVSALYKG